MKKTSFLVLIFTLTLGLFFSASSQGEEGVNKDYLPPCGIEITSGCCQKLDEVARNSADLIEYARYHYTKTEDLDRVMTNISPRGSNVVAEQCGISSRNKEEYLASTTFYEKKLSVYIDRHRHRHRQVNAQQPTTPAALTPY